MGLEVLEFDLEGLRDLKPEDMAEELKDYSPEEVVEMVGDYIYDYYDGDINAEELEFLWDTVNKDAVAAYLDSI